MEQIKSVEQTFWNAFFTMTPEKVLTLILFGASWILYLIFKYSGESYLKKKGENLAQKQDIEELTTLVKDVEQTFIEKSEKLRHSLDKSKQLQVSFYVEERNSIVELNSAVHIYHKLILNVTSIMVDIDNVSEVKKFKNTLDNYWFDVMSNATKAALFITDETIRIEGVKIIKLIHDEGAKPLSRILINMIVLKEEFNKKAISIDSFKVSDSRIVDEIGELLDKYVEETTRKVNEFTITMGKYLLQKATDLNN